MHIHTIDVYIVRAKLANNRSVDRADFFSLVSGYIIVNNY